MSQELAEHLQGLFVDVELLCAPAEAALVMPEDRTTVADIISLVAKSMWMKFSDADD